MYKSENTVKAYSRQSINNQTTEGKCYRCTLCGVLQLCSVTTGVRTADDWLVDGWVGEWVGGGGLSIYGPTRPKTIHDREPPP
jgi:hypothetical protein